MSIIARIEKYQNLIKGHQELAEKHQEISRHYKILLKELRKQKS